MDEEMDGGTDEEGGGGTLIIVNEHFWVAQTVKPD